MRSVLRSALSSGILALSCSVPMAPAAHAAPVAIQYGKPLPRTALLKEGVHHYLRYIRDGEASIPLDIWSREVRFETHQGEKRLHIRQRWDAAGNPGSVKRIDSWAYMDSFKPISHERITEKDGKRTVEGFVFAEDKITGMADLADNTQKNFLMPSAAPTFNFETDLEFFQTLAFAPGYEAQVNFYHPGGAAAPAAYLFKVVGEDIIAGPSGNVDCWRVTTDYNQPGSLATFWFAKQTQVMLRQEARLPDGRTLVKTLLD